MPKCVKTEGGYSIGGEAELEEVVVLVDVKKGLALWFGARVFVETRLASLRNRCKKIGALDQFEKDIRLLSLPDDVAIDEMNWMIDKRLLPRRVAMRIKDGGK